MPSRRWLAEPDPLCEAIPYPRRPNPSAIIAVTSVFKLTPSCRALDTSRACKLRGTRCRHCPLPELAFGASSPDLAQLSKYAFTASRPL